MEAADKPDSVGVEESGYSMTIKSGEHKPRHSFQEAGQQGAEVGPEMKGQDFYQP